MGWLYHPILLQLFCKRIPSQCSLIIHTIQRKHSLILTSNILKWASLRNYLLYDTPTSVVEILSLRNHHISTEHWLGFLTLQSIYCQLYRAYVHLVQNFLLCRSSVNLGFCSFEYCLSLSATQTFTTATLLTYFTSVNKLLSSAVRFYTISWYLFSYFFFHCKIGHIFAWETHLKNA